MSNGAPIGLATEVTGGATITRTDGTVENLTIGTEIYQGDIIETSFDGAVNITFTDESSFAVSEDSNLTIDEYVFDPSTEEGAQNFSMLKGMFVFTSGLIGRDDPDDVQIVTPSGSIGIRGTIIAGDADTGEVTVVEGAIVLRDNDGNEMTLANQLETAQFDTGNNGRGIENKGQLTPDEMNQRFSSISKVTPSLFSSINDSAAEAIDENGSKTQEQIQEDVSDEAQSQEQDAADETKQEDFVEADANGSADQNADNEIDGSVEETASNETSDGENAGENPTGENAEGPESASDDGGKKALLKALVQDQQTEDSEPVIIQQILESVHDRPADRTNTTQNTDNNDTSNTDTAGTEPYSPPPPPEDNGPEGIRIDSLFFNGSKYEANSGGGLYVGTIGHDKFTNTDSNSAPINGVTHMGFRVETGAGNDEVYIDSWNSSASAARGTGDLLLGNINLGIGNDKIALDFNNGFGTVGILGINGGAGNDDELYVEGFITGGNTLGTGNIQELKGIEYITLEDSGNAQDLVLGNALLDQAVLTSDLFTNDGTYYVDSKKTIVISGDSADTVDIDTVQWTKTSALPEEIANGQFRYEATINGEDVRLLIDSDISVI